MRAADGKLETGLTSVHDLAQIDTLLAVGIVVAIIAILGGIRGVYSVSVSARQDRTNQATTPLPVAPDSKRHKQRKAA